MKGYKAIFIDLCDTLMPFNNERIPEVAQNGLSVRSTSPIVYQVVKRHHPEISFEEFHRVFVDCYEEVMAIRERDHMEIPSPERFSLVLERLGIEKGTHFEELLREVVSAHMAHLSTCLEYVPEHKGILDRLQGTYRLALVSNFDYSPTVRHVLKRDGLHDYFETIIVSADMGLRKPHPELFLEPCRKMGLLPRDVLFVGDSLRLDVTGANGVGMDVVWLNLDGETPGPNQNPDFTLPAFSSLAGLLKL